MILGDSSEEADHRYSRRADHCRQNHIGKFKRTDTEPLQQQDRAYNYKPEGNEHVETGSVSLSLVAVLSDVGDLLQGPPALEISRL